VPDIALPMHLSATPLAAPVAAPRLGEHTETVLAEVLGHDAARIEALRSAGAFGR